MLKDLIEYFVDDDDADSSLGMCLRLLVDISHEVSVMESLQDEIRVTKSREEKFLEDTDQDLSISRWGRRSPVRSRVRLHSKTSHEKAQITCSDTVHLPFWLQERVNRWTLSLGIIIIY